VQSAGDSDGYPTATELAKFMQWQIKNGPYLELFFYDMIHFLLQYMFISQIAIVS
jgi:hypothetical protein